MSSWFFTNKFIILSLLNWILWLPSGDLVEKNFSKNGSNIFLMKKSCKLCWKFQKRLVKMFMVNYQIQAISKVIISAKMYSWKLKRRNGLCDIDAVNRSKIVCGCYRCSWMIFIQLKNLFIYPQQLTSKMNQTIHTHTLYQASNCSQRKTTMPTTTSTAAFKPNFQDLVEVLKQLIPFLQTALARA